MAGGVRFTFNQKTLDEYMSGAYGVNELVHSRAAEVYNSAQANAGEVASQRAGHSWGGATFEDYPASLYLERTTLGAVSPGTGAKNPQSRLAWVVGSNWTRPWVRYLPNGSGNEGSLWVERLFTPILRALAANLSKGKVKSSSRRAGRN